MAVTYYKAFDHYLHAHKNVPNEKPFKYKVGETYFLQPTHIYKTDIPIVCRHGFHYCNRLYGVWSYWPESAGIRVCVVEPGGYIRYKQDNCLHFRKYASSQIRIVRELSHQEIVDILTKERGRIGVNSLATRIDMIISALECAWEKARHRRNAHRYLMGLPPEE